MEKWSKKFNTWFLLEEKNRHPRNKNLYKVKGGWYQPKKDIIISDLNVQNYIDKCENMHKRYKKIGFLNKKKKESDMEQTKIS